MDFSFDDRLGNVWSGGISELAATDPKEFSILAAHSPAKHWALKVAHVVQVIPGIRSTIELKGGE
ncbi:MAG: hypothetical protein M0T74_02780 [Desulfitobacterium hafniense]|nr:hypothetical protein [Desulfitobacterium hafniense]